CGRRRPGHKIRAELICGRHLGATQSEPLRLIHIRQTPSFPDTTPREVAARGFIGSGAIMKFGVGQPVRRFEDQTLITGNGRYTDDIGLENAAYAYVLRARVAHANIRSIDAAAARQMPGVLLVLTGEDVK